MTTLKEFVIQSVGEPYSIKIERGQKGGYGYELSVKAEDPGTAVREILEMKAMIEKELYGSCQGGCNGENK